MKYIFVLMIHILSYPNHLLSYDSNVPYLSALYYRAKRSEVECSAVKCSTVECSALQMKL